MPHMPVRPWICALLLMTAASAHAGEVSLGVAANFTDTTRELVQAFEASTGHTASASFGSTGKLYAQIRNGAPYHVFMAADVRRPERIEQEGAGVPGTRFTYARGKLVLWSPAPDAFESPQDFLAEGDFQRLAIANPKTAPYGLAAQQVLQALDLWQALEPRLVRGDSIAQAFQFVATGNAEAGFVALSQVRAWPEQEGRSWPVPQHLYPPIEQQAIMLRRGGDNDAARAWLDFLQTGTAHDIIRRSGYDLPD